MSPVSTTTPQAPHYFTLSFQQDGVDPNDFKVNARTDHYEGLNKTFLCYCRVSLISTTGVKIDSEEPDEYGFLQSTVYFDHCSATINYEYCEFAGTIHYDIPPGQEPQTMIVDADGTPILSDWWNAFSDDLENECGLDEDCHRQITQTVVGINCNTCTDDTACDNDDFTTCDPPIDFNLVLTSRQDAVTHGQQWQAQVDADLLPTSDGTAAPERANYKLRIKGSVTYNGDLQEVFSDPFWVKTDWHSQCHRATLFDEPTLADKPIANLPAWGTPHGPIDWGQYVVSDSHFYEFKNDMCPEWCPLLSSTQVACINQTYDVMCKQTGPTDPGLDYETVQVPNQLGFTAVIDTMFPWTPPANQAAWLAQTRGREYPIEVFTDDPSTAVKTFECIIIGWITTDQRDSITVPPARSLPFDIQFNVCGMQSFCQHVTHFNLPSNALTPEFDAASLEMIYEWNKWYDVHHHGGSYDPSLASNPFVPFPDDLTATACGINLDCHRELDLTVEYIMCNQCTDETLACDDPGCTWVTGTNFNIYPTDASQNLYEFHLDDSFIANTLGLRTHYRVRVKGEKTSAGSVIQTVYTDSWDLKINAIDWCVHATLLDVGINHPSWSKPIPFGVTGSDSDNTFEEFENDICPFYCPRIGQETCPQPVTYFLECKIDASNLFVVPPTTFLEHTVTEVIPATSPPTYTSHISSVNPAVIGDLPGDVILTCRLGGTLYTSTKYSDEFQISFEPCTRPMESCLENTWTTQANTALDLYPFEFKVFQESDEIVFRHDDWKDWFSLYCYEYCSTSPDCSDPDVCGPRVFKWEIIPVPPETDTTLPFICTPIQDPLDSSFVENNSSSHSQMSIKLGSNTYDDFFNSPYFMKVAASQELTGLVGYKLENDWQAVEIIVLDPCPDAEFKVLLADPAPANLEVQIIAGSFNTSAVPFTNTIHEEFYEDFGEPNGWSKPLCGYPTEYKLVTPELTDLPFTCSKVDAIWIETDQRNATTNEPILYNTGEIEVICESNDVTQANTTYSVMIEAFNLTEEGEKVGTGHSKPFTIRFWMPPPELSFSVSEDASPEITDIPNDFAGLIGEFGDQFWKVAISDDGDAAPTIEVEIGSASSFLEVKQSSDSVEFYLTAEKAVEGMYQIKIKATDDGEPPNSKAEIFTIIITSDEFIVNEVRDSYINRTAEVNADDLEPLDVWIESINSIGLMEIRYSDKVIPIKNITNVTELDYLIEFEQFSDEIDQTREFNWTLIKFHYEYILTQLHFIRPLEISQGDILDQVTVYMRRELFMERDLYGIWKNYTDEEDTEEQIVTDRMHNGPELAPNPEGRRLQNRRRLIDGKVDYQDDVLFVKLTKAVPNQIDQDQQLLLADQANSAEQLLDFIFYVPLVIQIVMSGAMAHVWNLMNTMQIVNTFPLYQIKVPENVIQMQIAFQKFSNVQILPKKDIYDSIMDYMRDPPPEPDPEQEGQEQDAGTEDQPDEQVDDDRGGPAITKSEKTAQDLGMDTGKILEGAMQLVAGGVCLLIIVFIIYCIDNYAVPFLPLVIINAYINLKAKIFWNSVLRAMIEQYLPTCMATFKSIQNGNEWSNFETVMNSLASFLFVPYIIAYPIWIIYFLKRNRYLLSDRKFMGKYGSIYLNVDYFKFGGLPFVAILIFRRCLYAFNVIFLADIGYSALIQLQVSLWASQAICQYLVRVRPMIDLPNNMAQMFNEISILFFCVMMHNFTDHIPDPDARYQIGWYFLYILYFVMAVNVAIILVLIIKQVLKSSMRRHALRKQKARLKIIAEHNAAVDAMMPNRTRKEKKPHYMKNSNDNSFSISSNEESVDIDKIGMQKKVKQVVERTFLQKRKDAKEYFEARMQKMHDDESKMQKELDLMALKHNKDFGMVNPEAKRFAEKKAEDDKKTLPTQVVEDWEEAMWNDIAMDPSGNVIKLKQATAENQEDWEVVSSPSVRERRRLQQASDWPLSARGNEERQQINKRHKNRLNKEHFNDGKDAGSEQWSWDNENAGSNISQWMGVPDDVKGPVDNCKGYFGNSFQDSFFGQSELDFNQERNEVKASIGRRIGHEAEGQIARIKKANPQQSSGMSYFDSSSESQSSNSQIERRMPQEEEKQANLSSSFAISSADEFFESRSIYSKNMATAQSFLHSNQGQLQRQKFRSSRPNKRLDKGKQDEQVEDMFGQQFDWINPN